MAFMSRNCKEWMQRRVQIAVSPDRNDKNQFDHAMSAVRKAPEMVALGKDGRGEDHFTSRDMTMPLCEPRSSASTGSSSTLGPLTANGSSFIGLEVARFSRRL